MIDATDGRGADVVVEHVGEATWRTSQDVASQGGRIVVCGATTGPNPPAALHRIWWKELAILGSSMGTTEDFEAVYELVKGGRAKVDRRLVVPARRNARRARAPGSRRAVREDRPDAFPSRARAPVCVTASPGRRCLHLERGAVQWQN